MSKDLEQIIYSMEVRSGAIKVQLNTLDRQIENLKTILEKETDCNFPPKFFDTPQD